MASIVNQNSYPDALPDLRNLGVVLRILVIVNLAAAAAALVKGAGPQGVWHALLEVAVVLEPALIASVLVLMACIPALRRLPYFLGATSVVSIELVLATIAHRYAKGVLHADTLPIEHYWLIAAALTFGLLGYFNLRSRALSPALAEARLQALQARIRPHFLFNSINAVLSLVRADPRRAERALEDMADLFRVLMADNRELVPLVREVELCREYLSLEALRLGERLGVEWHVERMPGDALIPPLVLQPLLENAVYHGIEPRVEPGVISINIYCVRGEVHAVLRNPYSHDGDHHAGNKMAIANIRERLQLHFDAEASLTARVGDATYEVHIVIPYRTVQR